jgi:hypothetical protein
MSHTTKMNWIAAKGKQGFDEYELWNGEQRLMTLEFNQFSQTAKIECLNSRRIFKIDKEGFLGNKTILKNEYGIKIGHLSGEHWFNHEGIIELNDEKFHYTTINAPLAELVIYTDSPKNPLLKCGISLENGNTSINFEKHKEAEQHSIFLMALAWFLFLPVAKETIREYAI